MGEQLFDKETRCGHHPNDFKLVAKFEISTKAAQRSIDYFLDRLS